MAGTTRPLARPQPTRDDGEAGSGKPSPTPPGGPRTPASLPKVCPACRHRYPGEFRLCPRDGEELDEVDVDQEQDELVGTTLGGIYAIVRIIGEGGMGRVYEARHTRIRTKRFAIKVLHPEYARQPDVITRFSREAEAAAAIQSPFVVDVYDVDRAKDGRPYIACEYLDGTELAVHLQQVGKIPVAEAVRLARQLCKALFAAHEQGVIHRDMKPENVFLTGDRARPIAKIIDFGISKFKDEEKSSLTKTGMIMGTPSYMAPEQARGERVDHRADIYAVGAILYAMLTGKRPFDRGDPTATLTAVLTEDPERPRSLEPSIPEALELVIQRAMAKSPDDRYASMAELDADLALFEPHERESAELGPASAAQAMTAVFTERPPPRREAATALDRQVRESALARPSIVLYAVLGTFWLVGATVTLVAGAMRMLRGGSPAENLTSMEAGLLLGASFVAMITPLALAIRHLRREVWKNTARALGVAESLRRPVVIGLVAYGFGALLVRATESVVLRRSVGVAWPAWDLLLALVTFLAAGLGTLVLRRPGKGRRGKG